MLDADVFAHEMGVLADRFGRSDLSEEVLERYYESLRHLSHEEFLGAVAVIFRDDTYWPAPARFLDIAGTSTDAKARDAWDRALDDARNARRGLPYGAYPDPAEGAALQTVGGLRRIGLTSEDRLPWLRKEFVAAYKERAERAERPALIGPGSYAVLDPEGAR